jgi:UDP-glucuronate decarboxylase
MMDYSRQNKIEVRIARIFNTYGPRMSVHDGRVVSNLIVQSLTGKPMTVYGDGQQTRSFCYVSDMISGLKLLMDYEEVALVNLGNPEEVAIREIAEVIRELSGSRVEIEFAPLPQDDPTRRRPDISRAKSWLKWEPKISLREGLKATIDYFDDYLSSHSSLTSA